MLDNLYAFWVLDQRRRLRAVAVASFIVIGVEAFCEFVIEANRATSGWVALSVGLGVLFLWPFLAGARLPVSAPSVTPRLSLAIASVCSAAILFLPKIATPVQASMISSQLRATIAGEPYSVKSLETALELGARFKIPVDRNLLARAGQVILKNAPQAVSAAARYQSALRDQPSPDLHKAVRYPDIVLDSGSSLSDEMLARMKTVGGFLYLAVERNPSPKIGGFSLISFSLNDPAKPWGPNAVLPQVRLFGKASEFDGALVQPLIPSIDPIRNRIPASAFAEYLVISAPPASTIELGMFRFKNVVFENSRIRYNGSTTALDNVYFINCTFVIAPGTPDKIQFLQALLAPGPTHYETYITPEELRRLNLIPPSGQR